jgi:hypothetical protein
MSETITTPVTYTRAQVTAAMGTAHGMIDSLTGETGFLGHMPVGVWAQLREGTFTYGQVSAALNSTADAIRDQENPDGWEDSGTILMDDTLNLMVNATGYLLVHPDADLDTIIVASYGRDASPDLEGRPMPERGSAAWDKDIIAEVLGWFGCYPEDSEDS